MLLKAIQERRVERGVSLLTVHHNDATERVVHFAEARLRSNSKAGVNGSQRAGSSTKKNGAGGKGTWGKLGDEYKGTHVMDKGDPNYDDEAEAAVFEASS